jgi:two-component system, NtrC family, sensor kinase
MIKDFKKFHDTLILEKCNSSFSNLKNYIIEDFLDSSKKTDNQNLIDRRLPNKTLENDLLNVTGVKAFIVKDAKGNILKSHGDMIDLSGITQKAEPVLIEKDSFDDGNILDNDFSISKIKGSPNDYLIEDFIKIPITKETLKLSIILDLSSLQNQFKVSEKILTLNIVLFLVILLVFICLHLKSRIFNPIKSIIAKIKSLKSINELSDSNKATLEDIIPFLDDIENQLELTQKDLVYTKQNFEKTLNLLQETKRESEHLHRLASIGMVSSGIAHEIGNPLGTISALVNSLKDDGSGEIQKDKILEDIQNELKRIEQIIKKILNFARPKEEKEEIVDICNIIDESIELCSYHKNFVKIKFEKKFSENPYFIELKKNQIKQVFINIINNALDAMPEGGELSIKTTLLKGTPHELEDIKLKKINNTDSAVMIDITFIDSGTGIEQSDLPLIFSPFYTSGKEKTGTGLGLYISYQIIRQMGGVITAEHADGGKGTIVHVKIPTKDENQSLESTHE